jgi:membrane protease YdiL (CAAX protease family)
VQPGINAIAQGFRLLAVGFGFWSWRRRADRPKDLLPLLSGMVLESVLFALGLWAVGHGVGQLLDHLQATVTNAIPVEEAVGQVVTFVGAGIYEEALFRLLLFTALLRLLDRLDVPPLLMLTLAALTSSALFAAAHHIGPYGEPFDSSAFVFRLVAGIYFALLYQVRGFGIAAGAHALYDVLAGIAIG